MAEPSQINVTSNTANASRNLIHRVAELTGKGEAIPNIFISYCSNKSTLSPSTVCYTYTNTGAATTKLYLQPNPNSVISTLQLPFYLKRHLHFTRFTRLGQVVASTIVKRKHLFFAQVAEQLFVLPTRFTTSYNFIFKGEIKFKQEKLKYAFVQARQSLVCSEERYSKELSTKSDQ